MQIDVVLRLREHGTALKALALRRTRFALRRVLGLSPRVEVTLSDVPPGADARDKQCEVRLDTPATGSVVARSLASDWRAAMDHALARAVRRLLAACRRMWQPDPRVPALALRPRRIDPR
jgi:hypothetical protein